MWITLLLISHPLFQGDERQQRAGRGCGIRQRGGEDGHDGGDRGLSGRMTRKCSLRNSRSYCKI